MAAGKAFLRPQTLIECPRPASTCYLDVVLRRHSTSAQTMPPSLPLEFNFGYLSSTDCKLSGKFFGFSVGGAHEWAERLYRKRQQHRSGLTMRLVLCVEIQNATLALWNPKLFCKILLSVDIFWCGLLEAVTLCRSCYKYSFFRRNYSSYLCILHVVSNSLVNSNKHRSST